MGLHWDGWCMLSVTTMTTCFTIVQVLGVTSVKSYCMSLNACYKLGMNFWFCLLECRAVVLDLEVVLLLMCRGLWAHCCCQRTWRHDHIFNIWQCILRCGTWVMYCMVMMMSRCDWLLLSYSFSLHVHNVVHHTHVSVTVTQISQINIRSNVH